MMGVRAAHIGLLALLLLAGALRIGYLDDSRFMAERQFRSALIARADYLATTVDVTDPRRIAAETSARRLGVLEPPIMESLAVTAYRVLDGEALWIPRALATLAWLAGGALLFMLARRYVTEIGALIACAYFLFLPLGVLVSISFLPDSLMLALFLASLLGIVRHEEMPTTRRLLVAGALAGACVLVKPLCLFGLAGAFAALRLDRAGLAGLFDRTSMAFGTLLLLPALAYYAYGMFVAGFLEGQAAASFLPELLLRFRFWLDTFRTLVEALGAAPLVLAVLGMAIPASRRFRALLAGLIAGHFLLCLVFTYHVQMAAHYHLALVIPVAMCLGAAMAGLIQLVRSQENTFARLSSLAAAPILTLVLAYLAISSSVTGSRPLVDEDVARTVGQVVGHSTRVVYVSQYYGMPLEYFGALSGWFWPNPVDDVERALNGTDARARSVEERLSSLGSVLSRAEPDFRPEYFVITDFQRYANHPDLDSFLRENCRILAEEPRFLVFGDCQLAAAASTGI